MVRKLISGLPSGPGQCYFITVRHFLFLLLICALTVSNAAGLAAATCRHDSASAHAAALQSADISVATVAAREETAARSIEKDGALADAAAASLTSFILPADDLAYLVSAQDSSSGYLTRSAILSGRSLRPPLDPPLA